MKLKILILVTFFVLLKGFSQTSGIHSHNDYEQKIPFWDAYAHGATSIEADIFLKNNELFIAHEAKNIQPERTLESLYLLPIQEVYASEKFHSRPIQLLIDIKTQAKPTLQKLQEVLKPYQKNLYPYNPKGVKIVISGNRPEVDDYKNYPKHIFFDYQSTDLPKDLSKIAMLSLDFKEYSVWNGKGKIVKKEQEKLNQLIALAKKNYLPIRFWANPDTKSGWQAFKKMGVDFIGTDNPAKAEAYFENLERNNVVVDCDKDVYKAKFKVDDSAKKVKNVIFFIGDGMGLAQISTTSMFCPDMMLNQFKNIGFIKTSSVNDYTTDSAASGTAFAIGEKTNNRAVGVDKNDIPKPSLIEILSQKGFKTGILTTDEITGATPADFYAHVPDRGMKAEIANDLIKSNVDFFMGGDRKFFAENHLNQQLENKGFQIFQDFKNLDDSAKRIAFFAGNYSVPYMRDGRGNLLPNATEYAINYLKEKPFFMMVEAAQIDNYGHFNDIKGVAEETIDLDNAIQKAIEFADKDGETLIVITADHECGGLTLPHGVHEHHEVEGDFSTHDHTGIMVPVYAYGPQSSEFQGVYENSEIFHKILKVLNINQ